MRGTYMLQRFAGDRSSLRCFYFPTMSPIAPAAPKESLSRPRPTQRVSKLRTDRAQIRSSRTQTSEPFRPALRRHHISSRDGSHCHSARSSFSLNCAAGSAAPSGSGLSVRWKPNRIQYQIIPAAEEIARQMRSLVHSTTSRKPPRLLDLWQGAHDRLYSRLFQS